MILYIGMIIDIKKMINQLYAEKFKQLLNWRMKNEKSAVRYAVDHVNYPFGLVSAKNSKR